jgi:hypothetical protein
MTAAKTAARIHEFAFIASSFPPGQRNKPFPSLGKFTGKSSKVWKNVRKKSQTLEHRLM